ncbi:MAG: Omp28-related outer membrane protein [Flavobacteriales bacterium]|nr:Omp28-related outer membrane protein [Flavobacteriales bacterium]MBP6696876.1 Omp28-related outer membrane protein [Flavobacteriales bacterium]
MLRSTHTRRSATPSGVLVFALLISSASAFAQVGQDPQPRKALVEQFTALHCGNCPEGHVISNVIMNAHPQDVVVVGLHAGSLAVPSAGQPDFRTMWSTDLHDHFNVPFTPLAVVNRRDYNGTDLLSSGAWSSAVDAVLQLPAPVNIGVTNSFNVGTRELTVTADLYYTANSPTGNDRIHVLITQDHITGWQTDYGAGGNQPNYDHRHVLRAYLTPLEGDEVTTTSAGDAVMRTYAYTVPTDWDIAQCRTVVFVSEASVGSTYGEVYQVASAASNNGSTGFMEEQRAAGIGVPYPNPATTHLFVPVEAAGAGGLLELRDASGRVVHAEMLGGAGSITVIEVHDLVPGVYSYRLAERMAGRFVIMR